MATGRRPGRGKVIMQLAHLLSSQLPRGALRFTFPRKTVLVSSAPALLHHGSSWQPFSDVTWYYRVAAGSEVTSHERSSSVEPSIHSHFKGSSKCEPVYSLRPALPPRLFFSSKFPPLPPTASAGLLHSERTRPFSSDAAQPSGEQQSAKEEGDRGRNGGANTGGGTGWFSRLKNVFTKMEAAEEVVLTLDRESRANPLEIDTPPPLTSLLSHQISHCTVNALPTIHRSTSAHPALQHPCKRNSLYRIPSSGQAVPHGM